MQIVRCTVSLSQRVIPSSFPTIGAESGRYWKCINVVLDPPEDSQLWDLYYKIIAIKFHAKNLFEVPVTTIELDVWSFLYCKKHYECHYIEFDLWTRLIWIEAMAKYLCICKGTSKSSLEMMGCNFYNKGLFLRLRNIHGGWSIKIISMLSLSEG